VSLSLSFTIRALVLLGLALGGAACKPTTPATDASALRDDAAPQGPLNNKCKCEDLACWKKETDEQTVKQFECAKSALDAAGTLASGGAKTVYDVTTGVIDAGLALSQNDQELLTIFSNLAKGGDIAASAGVFGPDGRALVQCVATSASLVNNVLEIIKTTIEFSPREGKDKPEGQDAFNKIVGMWGSSMDATFKFAGAMTECIKAADPKSLDSRSVVAFRRFMDSWTKVLGAIKAAIGIAECGGKIYSGGKVLIGNAICLEQDLKKLEESRRAVQRALAYEGSRQFNHAKFTGCSECVYSSWRDSTETEYKNCRSCCERKGAEWVKDGFPKKRASWVTSCQLTCGVARTEGLFWNYTDEQACKEVKNMFAPSRGYRHIDIVYADQYAGKPAGKRKEDAEAERAEVVKHLNVIKSNFDAFVAASQSAAGVTDMIQQADFHAVADGNYSAEMKAAGAYFSKKYVSGTTAYYFGLLDTADARFRNADNKVAPTDVQYFLDEISEYRDESEFE